MGNPAGRQGKRRFPIAGGGEADVFEIERQRRHPAPHRTQGLDQFFEIERWLFLLILFQTQPQIRVDAIDREPFQPAFDQTAPLIIRDHPVDGQAGKRLIALNPQIGKRNSAGEAALDFEISANAGFFKVVNGHARGDPPQSRPVQPNEPQNQRSKDHQEPVLPASFRTRRGIGVW